MQLDTLVYGDEAARMVPETPVSNRDHGRDGGPARLDDMCQERVLGKSKS